MFQNCNYIFYEASSINYLRPRILDDLGLKIYHIPSMILDDLGLKKSYHLHSRFDDNGIQKLSKKIIRSWTHHESSLESY